MDGANFLCQGLGNILLRKSNIKNKYNLNHQNRTD